MLLYCIVIADRHSMFRSAVKKILDENREIVVVGETGSPEELYDLLRQKSPDLIIINTPDFFDHIDTIKRSYPHIKILVLTIDRDLKSIHDALTAGADGYLLKSDTENELFSAIEFLRNDNSYISPLLAADYFGKIAKGLYKRGLSEDLTVREKEIVKLIIEGKSNKEIGKLLFISPKTVQHHRARIMRKLNLKRTADLVKYVVAVGDSIIQNNSHLDRAKLNC